jgi:mono/diheme cytochrome c family protein
MPTSTPRQLRARKIVFVLILLLICLVLGFSVYQQNLAWVVPEEFKQLKNPLPPTDSNLQAARDLYREECAQCHGEHGKGDGPEANMHSTPPADLTDAARMRAVTDGEIFYQISLGRRPMPSFKNRTTEDQRWQLVLLVRSFTKDPHQKLDQPEEDRETTPKP